MLQHATGKDSPSEAKRQREQPAYCGTSTEIQCVNVMRSGEGKRLVFVGAMARTARLLFLGSFKASGICRRHEEWLHAACTVHTALNTSTCLGLGGEFLPFWCLVMQLRDIRSKLSDVAFRLLLFNPGASAQRAAAPSMSTMQLLVFLSQHNILSMIGVAERTVNAFWQSRH